MLLAVAALCAAAALAVAGAPAAHPAAAAAMVLEWPRAGQVVAVDSRVPRGRVGSALCVHVVLSAAAGGYGARWAPTERLCVEVDGAAAGCLEAGSDFVEIPLPPAVAARCRASESGAANVTVRASYPSAGLEATVTYVVRDVAATTGGGGSAGAPLPPGAGTRSLLPTLPVALVLCRYDEDVSWLSAQPFPAVVYEKAVRAAPDPTTHHVRANAASEASAFLQFVVDYYDALPERAVFLHSHRYAYHQEDLLALLPALDVHRGGASPGYVRLPRLLVLLPLLHYYYCCHSPADSPTPAPEGTAI